MKVGVPTEIKTDEYRVALTPAGVRELVEHGHGSPSRPARRGSAIADEEYTRRARRSCRRRGGVRGRRHDRQGQGAEAVEVAMLEPRHTLFTYLHLAPDPELTHG